jgi:energy-coupling factor transporter transmembrane protein EcfT
VCSCSCLYSCTAGSVSGFENSSLFANCYLLFASDSDSVSHSLSLTSPVLSCACFCIFSFSHSFFFPLSWLSCFFIVPCLLQDRIWTFHPSVVPDAWLTVLMTSCCFKFTESTFTKRFCNRCLPICLG